MSEGPASPPLVRPPCQPNQRRRSVIRVPKSANRLSKSEAQMSKSERRGLTRAPRSGSAGRLPLKNIDRGKYRQRTAPAPGRRLPSGLSESPPRRAAEGSEPASRPAPWACARPGGGVGARGAAAQPPAGARRRAVCYGGGGAPARGDAPLPSALAGATPIRSLGPAGHRLGRSARRRAVDPDAGGPSPRPLALSDH